MKKIIITYGLISGAIVSILLLVQQPLFEKGVLNMDNGMYVGFTSMIVALSLIFFAIKSYRDEHLKGSISFFAGFKIGILITLIASVLYALTWDGYYTFVGSDFLEAWQQGQLENMIKNGASEAELAAARKEQMEMGELYRNNFFVRFGFTLTEIVPVGLIITLVSAGLLRNNRFLPAEK